MLREYHLDLMQALPSMSWRRLMVLVRGLSNGSAIVTRMNADQYIGKKAGPKAVEAYGKEAAQRAFEALFKPRAKRQEN